MSIPHPQNVTYIILAETEIAEGKKIINPCFFAILCGLKIYWIKMLFTISLLRNKWIFTQVLSNMGILTPKSVLYTFNNHNILEPFWI